MGKMAAYLGPPTRVATLLEKGPQALVRNGATATGGFGVGWYPEDEDPEPIALVSAKPARKTDQLLRLTRRSRSGCILAGLRELSADELEESAGHQPFHQGDHLFFHDGTLTRFREVFERPLRTRLSDRVHRLLRGTSSAELLFATWLDALGGRRGEDAIAGALDTMAGVVREIAVRENAPATFAIVVADGRCLVTLRTSTHGTPPPMVTTVAEPGAPVPSTGRVIASEPIFPGAWTPLDLHSIVIFTGESASA